ncbi:hypothetical protein Dda_4981 [Drechslerella dactyloides]|uniref:Short-chain dehydrogenase n=1 Tax=Drechslerella dactyloides TaxID=74499 RepID=A0AAD6NJR4_DREDA|nr:hypothetical protein Dda_4981 [Drechslerella dactyloides]
MTSNASYDRSTSGAQVAQDFHDQVKGRNVLITGVGPAGIGEATLMALAAQQPNLITVTGRSSEKVNESIAKAKAAYPDANIKPLIMDLSSMASVRKAAAEFLATPEPLDILINNAGVMAPPTRLVSADNIEIQFATNHVGHYLFTNLIMSKILAAAEKSTKGATRIINVSSFGHGANPIRFSDWNWEGGDVPDSEKGSVEQLQMFNESDHTFTKYTPYGAYGQSKTANVLYSVELTRRLYEKHGVLSLALHPGGIMTQLARHISQKELEYWETVLKDFIYWKNGDQGSSTTLVAALDPAFNSWTEEKGYYLDDCQLKAPIPWAVDPEAAQRLWKLSEEIVGEKFDF